MNLDHTSVSTIMFGNVKNYLELRIDSPEAVNCGNLEWPL